MNPSSVRLQNVRKYIINIFFAFQLSINLDMPPKVLKGVLPNKSCKKTTIEHWQKSESMVKLKNLRGFFNFFHAQFTCFHSRKELGFRHTFEKKIEKNWAFKQTI